MLLKQRHLDNKNEITDDAGNVAVREELSNAQQRLKTHTTTSYRREEKHNQSSMEEQLQLATLQCHSSTDPQKTHF